MPAGPGGARPGPGPAYPLTSHQVLAELLSYGLGWDTALGLSFEDVACLLHHALHAQRIEQLEAEAQRLASLTLADQEEQHRAILAVRHRVQAELDRFHRPRLAKE